MSDKLKLSDKKKRTRQKLYSYAKNYLRYYLFIHIYPMSNFRFFFLQQSNRIKTQGSNNRFSSGPATLVTL
jgi:hypothetical protein